MKILESVFLPEINDWETTEETIGHSLSLFHIKQYIEGSFDTKISTGGTVVGMRVDFQAWLAYKTVAAVTGSRIVQFALPEPAPVLEYEFYIEDQAFSDDELDDLDESLAKQLTLQAGLQPLARF